MAGKKMGLGRGLDSLIPGSSEQAEKKGELIVGINDVEPNRDQPRSLFDENAMQELTESIRQYGVLQPLLVQKKDKYYEIIAGERRWRAAKRAGLKEIPVLVRNYTDQERMEIALIENIQREDLNPIEEALAYKRLINEYKMRQEELAARVSKSRTAVSNSMRLLKLDERVQQMVVDGKLSTGHARALLAISDKDEQMRLAVKISENGLSVRDTENLVQKKKPVSKPENKSRNTTKKAAIYKDMENQLMGAVGTKVKVFEKSAGKGKVEIEYYSEDDLERIYNILMSYRP